MKRKSLLAGLLAAVMLFSTACNVQTKSDANSGGVASGDGAAVSAAGINLKLLYQSANENIANVVRDELTKNGFTVEMSAAADGATFKEQQKNGNFDVVVTGWANVTGTPDYGCRGIWFSTGDSNLLGINNPELDALVIKAAGETPDQYIKTYGEAEKIAIEGECYMTPLYQVLGGRAYSKILKGETIINNMRWEDVDYVDESQRATRPLVLTQSGSSITTWDPIRADDASSGYALDEMYIHLVTLTEDWGATTDNSLSYNYAVSADNQAFYFVLRDDCGFARVDANGNAYDSGVKVAAEDVVYSLNRAKDKNSIPLHQTYSMYNNLDTVSIVTDKAELETVKTADGKNIIDVLNSNITPIASVVGDRKDVKNDAGAYQVVKCTTKVPFPQIINNLTFHGAGIVDSEWVENMNKGVDIAKYDATKDKLYGDSVTTVKGATYNNQISASGNYILTSMDDYQMNFQANPAIRTNDPDCVLIKQVTNKFIADTETALSALRSGDVDFCYAIPATKYNVVEADENLDISMLPGFRVFVLAFNMHGNSEVSKSADLRKAIASCIVYEDIAAVLAGNAIKCYSPLSTCLDTGNRLAYQPGDTQKYLKAYLDSKK